MLGEAVGQCVEAAGHEYDPQTQKSLLRVRAMTLLTGSCQCAVLYCLVLSTRRRRLESAF